MIVGCLGDISFAVFDSHVETIKNMVQNVSARYTTHQRAGGPALTESRQCGLWQLSVGYQICKIQDPAHRRFRYTDMDYRKRFFVGISERMR